MPEDLERLRAAWVEHGAAFPETKGFERLEKAVMKSSQRVVLLALFTSAYEYADLADPTLGWAISPVPRRAKELPENDAVLRTLMPVGNPWARYFLLEYAPETLMSAGAFIISNRTSTIEFKK
jgi:hypothetical protein